MHVGTIRVGPNLLSLRRSVWPRCDRASSSEERHPPRVRFAPPDVLHAHAGIELAILDQHVLRPLGQQVDQALAPDGNTVSTVRFVNEIVILLGILAQVKEQFTSALGRPDVLFLSVGHELPGMVLACMLTMREIPPPGFFTLQMRHQAQAFYPVRDGGRGVLVKWRAGGSTGRWADCNAVAGHRKYLLQVNADDC